jgi:uncharacterized repeat protein (TIGR02543 family)
VHEDLSDTPMTSFDEGDFAADMTLYAKWDYIEYTITYRIGFGQPDVTETYTILDEDFVFENIEVEGCVFSGWMSAETGGEEVRIIDTSACADITLYADLTPRVFKIYFDVSGASDVTLSALDCRFGDELPTLPQPEKRGYTFGGWFEDEDFEVPLTLGTMPAGSITLYGQLVRDEPEYDIEAENGLDRILLSISDGEKDYFLTLVLYGGSLDATAFSTASAATIPMIPVPVRDGYTFEGWYADEGLTAPYDGENLPTVDGTLYASWSLDYTLPEDRDTLDAGLLAGVIVGLGVFLVIAIILILRKYKKNQKEKAEQTKL